MQVNKSHQLILNKIVPCSYRSMRIKFYILTEVHSSETTIYTMIGPVTTIYPSLSFKVRT